GGLQRRQLVGGNQQQLVSHASGGQIPLAIDAVGIDDDHVVDMTRILEDGGSIAQILSAFQQQLGGNQDVDAIDLRHPRVPEVHGELMRALYRVQEAVDRFDLEQERNVARERVEIGQQHAFESQALTLERQVAGHRGGPASALGGHDDENFGWFLA